MLFVRSHLGPWGSQGRIFEKNISCKSSKFLSFWVNLSKSYELKGGVDNKFRLYMFYIDVLYIRAVGSIFWLGGGGGGGKKTKQNTPQFLP